MTHIKNILFRSGFGYVWIAQDVGDVKLFIVKFKQRLFDTLQQNWCSSVNNLSDTFYYKHYKSLLNVERYLTYEIPVYLKVIYTRFRCSNFRLAIDQGRYNKITYTERLCPYCLDHGLRYIEDELHTLLVCKRYSVLRDHYISKFIKNHSFQTFIDIMTSENLDVLFNVCLYLYNVQKLRKA